MVRSFTDRLLGGVCGGIAGATRVNAWLVRLIVAVLAVASVGIFALWYAALWGILRQETPTRPVAGRGLGWLVFVALTALAAGLWALQLQNPDDGLIVVALFNQATASIPPGLYDLLIRALPAVLVFVGLWVILKNRIPFGGVVALALTVTLVFNVALIAFSARANQPRTDYRVAIRESISPDVNLLRVSVELLAADLNILLAERGTISGAFVGSEESLVSVRYVEDGQGGALLELVETQPNTFRNLEKVGRGQLDLSLPPALATDLLATVQDGTATLDLGNIDLERLNLNLQSGSARVVIPEYAALSPDVSGNGTLNVTRGDLTLFIPETLGVRVEFPSFSAGDPIVDETIYNVLRDGTIESRNYDNAPIQVRYVVRVPGGRLTIQPAAR